MDEKNIMDDEVNLKINNQKTVTWDDIHPAAKVALDVWTHNRELKWAKEAWQKLTGLGLTVYNSELERVQVIIRLLIIIQIYLDWTHTVDDERNHPEAFEYYFEILDISLFRLGQLIGTTESFEDAYNETELIYQSLYYLTDLHRNSVVKALFQGFGGERGLFFSLWNVNNPSPESIELEEDNQEFGIDDDYYIITSEEYWSSFEHPTIEMLIGFEWIDSGCPSIGRTRMI